MGLGPRIQKNLPEIKDRIDYFALSKLVIVVSAIVIALEGVKFVSNNPGISQIMLETGKSFFTSTIVTYSLFVVFGVLGFLHVALNLNFTMGGILKAATQAISLAGGFGASYTFLGSWFLQTFFSSEGHQYFVGFTQSEMGLLLALMIVLFAFMCKEAYAFSGEIIGTVIKRDTMHARR